MESKIYTHRLYFRKTFIAIDKENNNSYRNTATKKQVIETVVGDELETTVYAHFDL